MLAACLMTTPHSSRKPLNSSTASARWRSPQLWKISVPRTCASSRASRAWRRSDARWFSTPTPGATWDARRVRGRLRAQGVRRRLVATERPDKGWAALTESELTVVRLVAEGLTNRDAAERLFVSRQAMDGTPSTVDWIAFAGLWTLVGAGYVASRRRRRHDDGGEFLRPPFLYRGNELHPWVLRAMIGIGAIPAVIALALGAPGRTLMWCWFLSPAISVVVGLRGQ
jgi:MYXO-CTERM domain-containing protein